MSTPRNDDLSMVMGDHLRFWSKVHLSTSGCWEWTSWMRGHYGDFWLSGRTRYAHRVAYTAFHGAIPEGLTVDHLCKNTKCVNPGHMELVSLRTNVLRSDNVCAINKRKTHCKRGHIFDAKNTGPHPKGRVCRACERARNTRDRLKKAAGRPLLRPWRCTQCGRLNSPYGQLDCRNCQTPRSAVEVQL